MRWNMVLGALVVSVGLCGQSYGFELLERMLGLGGGCESDGCRAVAICVLIGACILNDVD